MRHPLKKSGLVLKRITTDKLASYDAAAFGAISVASAMFLILDLTQPYSGLFRVPPSAIRQALEAIDK